jgi:hypothetical protein
VSLVVDDAGSRVVGGDVEFDVVPSAKIEIVVLDIAGRVVARPWSGRIRGNAHRVTWDARDLHSGIYLYWVKSEGYEIARKFTLLR